MTSAMTTTASCGGAGGSNNGAGEMVEDGSGEQKESVVAGPVTGGNAVPHHSNDGMVNAADGSVIESEPDVHKMVNTHARTRIHAHTLLIIIIHVLGKSIQKKEKIKSFKGI